MSTEGERLRAFLQRAAGGRYGWISELEKDSGVGRATMYKWFKGENTPDLAKLGQIAEKLGVPRAALVAAMDDEPALEPAEREVPPPAVLRVRRAWWLGIGRRSLGWTLQQAAAAFALPRDQRAYVGTWEGGGEIRAERLRQAERIYGFADGFFDNPPATDVERAQELRRRHLSAVPTEPPDVEAAPRRRRRTA
jgi:transcriptional regulator with XRE-family HTH domain